MEENIVVYCAMPFHPGGDDVRHSEWGFDVGACRYAHESCGEKTSGVEFYETIKDELPGDWKKHWDYPAGGPTAEAVSWQLPLSQFQNPDAVRLLLRRFWPKACEHFGV